MHVFYSCRCENKYRCENKPEYPVAVVVDVIVDGACLVDGAVEFDTTLAGANFFSILN